MPIRTQVQIDVRSFEDEEEEDYHDAWPFVTSSRLLARENTMPSDHTCPPTLLESSDDGRFLDPLYLSFSSWCSACNVLSVTGGDAMVASREGPRQIAPCMIHHRRHRPPIRGLWNAVQAGRLAERQGDGQAGGHTINGRVK